MAYFELGGPVDFRNMILNGETSLSWKSELFIKEFISVNIFKLVVEDGELYH